ncbi:choline transporter [Gallibacterium salpingitidis]|uniref:Choline transporter n=1 Tax=Gallibacterium salpingitidis TaxID=505341 RepID=A0AB36E3E8_9PAST|nr:BCCT family transporter [Gallibacterium salpingitidis]OBX09145.1 choline transporter [Gallibacterium salpingitidis]OBX10958.1 choline transporter [Gallibacterium salpingitidis]WKS99664.1 BCCT family transporter [Gallibacterium salpingitidis]
MASNHLQDSFKLNYPVFLSAAVTSLIIGVVMVIAPDKTAESLGNIQSWISDTLGWYYVLLMTSCLVFVFWLAFSKYKNIQLSQVGESPEFSFKSWVSMLFSAGIGIGILYYGAFEAIDHYLHPPVDLHNTAAQAREAMVITFLHWGLHGWALYALMGVVLAYFAYRKNLPLALRSPLYPILKERIYGCAGHCVDGFGIIATLISLITNLGMGTLLLYSGLSYLVDIPPSNTLLVSITIFMMLIATLVAITGVKKGISLLANINIIFMVAFLLFVFLNGKPIFLLGGLVQNIGDYLSSLTQKTFNMYLFEGKNAANWLSDWTIFYWAWWVAWAPFVGMFVARISKGRTIKELILGVMIVPLGFALVWMSVFGNIAMDLVINGNATEFAAAVSNKPVESMLYELMHYFPFTKIIIALLVFMGFVMFLTPVDSGLVMISNLSAKELPEDAEDAPVCLRIFWAIVITLLSVGLLFAGSFDAMQSAVVLCGLPFSVVLISYMIGILKDLRESKE